MNLIFLLSLSQNDSQWIVYNVTYGNIIWDSFCPGVEMKQMDLRFSSNGWIYVHGFTVQKKDTA